MSAICPDNFDVAQLRSFVRAEYARVARDPEGEYHFHRGPRYAADYLGYEREALAGIPALSSYRFAGVGNPLLVGDANANIKPLSAGETVLDHACGGGMDLLLAARRVGARGKAIGVDMTPGMCAVAREAALEAGLSATVEVHQGFYEQLPVADESVDVVISNGVLNLAPDKHIVMDEIYRVLKPGGRLFLADVIVQRELTLDARANPSIWAACVGGALVEHELAEIADGAGLCDARITRRFNCFHGTEAAEHVAKDLFVHSVNFYARKPEFRYVP